MDKNTARQLALEIEMAMKAIADKHGLVARVEGGRFNSSGYYPNLSLISPDADKQAFELWAPRYGLKVEDLNRTVIIKGRSFKIVGFDPGKPKFPVKAVRDDGQAFKLTVEAVKAAA